MVQYINDVSGLRDKQMLDLVLESGCASVNAYEW